MGELAKKETINKLSYCDLPIEAFESVAKVFQDSKASGKYPRDNHFKPIKNTDLLDATMRHLLEVMKGNDYDQSGNSHYSHMIANCLMLEYHFKNGTLIENRCKKLNNDSRVKKTTSVLE